MQPAELLGRLQDKANETCWRWRFHSWHSAPKPGVASDDLCFGSGVDPERLRDAPPEARRRLLSVADALLEGRWPTFDIERNDVTAEVDWHLDAKTGFRVRSHVYTFSIRINGEDLEFDTKHVWELSRHHQTTVLAMAYGLTGEEAYARRAVELIASWTHANPFLHGVHWHSGIELGMRLIAFVWVRRLLDGWSEVETHFERNPRFVELVYQHQWLLAHRRSSGSSANNHLLYETAGTYVAACAFPWFDQSARWREAAKRILEREFVLQTFPSGYNRELASEYGAFVLEVLLLCLAESKLTGFPLSDALWKLAAQMVHTFADLADCRWHPPRHGDGDNAHGLLLDPPNYERWPGLLELGGAAFGRSAWWPPLPSEPSLRAWVLAPILAAHRGGATATTSARISVLRDAGLVVLRAHSGGPNEIYCAFDCGPLGYLAIAAHAHADALAIELRYGGRPILVDPGTFNFTSSGIWRDYFRSTAAHNTVELGSVSQSTSGGPFLWTRHARATLLRAEGLDEAAPIALAKGEHEGYAHKPFRGTHSRTVSLNRETSCLEITDEIEVSSPTICRLMFHLHPAIACELDEATALLTWEDGDTRRELRLDLAPGLNWRPVCGSEDPVLGWYSPSYDCKVPTLTLVGEGTIDGKVTLRTVMQFGA